MKVKNSHAIFLVALIVRAAFVVYWRWSAGDSPTYLAIAKNLFFHHSFSETYGNPTALKPPLYPFFIAAFGWADGAQVTAVLGAQVVLGSATVVLVYLIASERFSHTVALVAALGMTLAPLTNRYTAVILTETLFTFLVTFGVFFWGKNKAVSAGLAFGLAALTRPIIIPFVCCLFLLSLLPAWRPHRRTYGIILIVTLAVSSVWIVRNAIVFRQFILIQSVGHGFNLFAGTIETPVLYEDWPKVLRELAAETESVSSEAEFDRLFMRKAINRIKTNPAHYLKVRLKQYPRLFLDTGDYLDDRRIAMWVFVVGNTVVLLLAICGLFTERERFVSLSHITLFPIFVSLIHLPMWIESRFSLPVMPLVAILATVGAVKPILSLAHKYLAFDGDARTPQGVSHPCFQRPVKSDVRRPTSTYP